MTKEVAKKEFFALRSDLSMFYADVGNIDYFLVNKSSNMTVKCVFHAHIGTRKWWFFPIIERLFF